MSIYGGRRGLAGNEAVKTENGYILNLGHGEYEVNGECIQGGKEIAVEDIDKIYRVSRNREVTHFEDKKTGDTYSPEYIRELRQKWDHLIDEDGDFIGNTEQELEYVKDKAVFRGVVPVHSDEYVTKTPVEISVIGYLVDTGSDFIETGPAVGNARSVFSVQESRIAKDECRKTLEGCGLSYDIPNHSNIRFVRVGAQYLFTEFKSTRYVYEDNSTRVYNKLEEAQKREREIREFVKQQLNTILKDKALDDVMLSDMLGDLRKIHGKVRDLDVKRKDESAQRSTLSAINESIKKITEQIEE